MKIERDERKFDFHGIGLAIKKADDRTRTDNLLITNQLLCQLSHIGVSYIS